MNEWIASFIPALQELGFAGYILLMAVTFGESFVLTGIIVPGTIILLIMGGLASYGYYSPLPLALAGLIGAMLGNMVSYELGRSNQTIIRNIRFLQSTLTHAQRFFEAHGGKSIILCRFIGPIRALVPFIAGVTHMKRPSFYGYTLVGGFLWIALYLAIGYAFGYAWKNALAWSSAGITLALIIIILCIILYRWLIASAPTILKK